MEVDETAAQTEWHWFEERALCKEEYKVQYEYTKRSISFKLRSLSLELWRTDPDLEIASSDNSIHPIMDIDAFPVLPEEYKKFFARVITENIGKCTCLTIRKIHQLNVLTQRNERALQEFLVGRKRWLPQHRF
jgi:hypothetical protein